MQILTNCNNYLSHNLFLMKRLSIPSLFFRFLPLFFAFIFTQPEKATAQTFEKLNFTFNKFYSNKPVASAAELERNNWIYAEDAIEWSSPPTAADAVLSFVYDLSPIPNEADLVYRQADEEPVFSLPWRAFVKESSPFFQQKANVEDTPCVVWVTATIEKDGRLTNPTLLTPNDYPNDIFPDYAQFRAEAHRVVTLMDEGWTPARHKGETVRYQKLFQIEFGW